MTDRMDWAAAMNSEVFRIYAENELQKIQSEQQTKKLAAKCALETEDEDVINALESFEQFERQVKASPTKLRVFRALQEKFASDAEYTAGVKKSFVDAVMLLNLD